MRDAVGARDGDECGVGVDRNPRLHIRRKFANLRGVLRGSHGVDLREAQRGGCGNEAGVNLQFPKIDLYCVGRRIGNSLADGNYAAAVYKHLAASDAVAGNSVNDAGAVQHGLRLRGGGEGDG